MKTKKAQAKRKRCGPQVEYPWSSGFQTEETHEWNQGRTDSWQLKLNLEPGFTCSRQHKTHASNTSKQWRLLQIPPQANCQTISGLTVGRRPKQHPPQNMENLLFCCHALAVGLLWSSFCVPFTHHLIRRELNKTNNNKKKNDNNNNNNNNQQQ